MSDFSRSTRTISAVAMAAVGFAACEAFAPQQTPLGAVAVISRSQGSRLPESTLLGFFGNSEKTEETSAADLVPSTTQALIEKTKDFVDNNSGFYSPASDESVFAEDFVFRGPYVGPLNKSDYLGTMEAFGIHKAFPDISPNSWGYSIDPKDPNRVWFMCRNTGTFTGEPLLPGVLNIQPTGAILEGPPETFSVVYDDDQKVKYFSVGYVADRFDGNTDGVGAAFGIFNIIGLSLPSPGPALRALQWYSSEFQDSDPRSYSTDVPEWFLREKGDSKGCSGYK